MHTTYLIKQINEQLVQLLLDKNQDYGDSATQGEPIFATDINKEQLNTKQFALCCRIDDKLHRIKNSGITDKTIDSVWDLAGYFTLLLVSFKQEENK